MFKKIVLLFLVQPLLNYSMEVTSTHSSMAKAVTVPKIVATIIMYLAPKLVFHTEPTKIAREKSRKAIIDLKSCLRINKLWNQAAQSSEVLEHFLPRMAYDNKLFPIYDTSSISGADIKSFGRGYSTHEIILQSLQAQISQITYYEYAQKNPSSRFAYLTSFIVTPAYATAAENEKADTTLSAFYKRIYAALNIYTKSARKFVLQEVKNSHEKGYHALLVCCIHGKSKMFHELLDQETNPNPPLAPIREIMPSVLHVAIAFNRVALVQRLLQHQLLETNGVDQLQETPISKALRVGNSTMIELLARDRRINLKNLPYSMMLHDYDLALIKKFKTFDVLTYCNYYLNRFIPITTKDILAKELQTH